jgi:hypothetical protein
MKAGEVRVQDLNGVEHLFWVGGGALEVQSHKITSKSIRVIGICQACSPNQ